MGKSGQLQIWNLLSKNRRFAKIPEQLFHISAILPSQEHGFADLQVCLIGKFVNLQICDSVKVDLKKGKFANEANL